MSHLILFNKKSNLFNKLEAFAYMSLSVRHF